MRQGMYLLFRNIFIKKKQKKNILLKNETLPFLVFFVITTFASMTVPNKTNVTQEKTRVWWSVFGVPCLVPAVNARLVLRRLSPGYQW